MQPTCVNAHTAGSVASESKLSAEGDMRPYAKYMQEPSSTLAIAMWLNAARSVQPGCMNTHGPSTVAVLSKFNVFSLTVQPVIL